ncbi:MAG: archaellin/type IV pilin N-terminal domain-containing protein [Thermoprotei archaeon]
MSKKNKNIKWSKVAIVGIESAIVLIAFVIVAAALAFVVLNMGFFTTQKSKETIGSGLGEASTAVEIDGSVVAHVNTTKQNVTYIYVPLKLSAGKSPVDLTPGKATIAYWSPTEGISYVDIYNSSLASSTYKTVGDVISAVKGAVNTYGYSNTGKTFAVIAWVTNINNDNVLDPGEKVILVVFFKPDDAPRSYDTLKIELKVPIGAALTIDRSIPPSLTQAIIDLG